MNRILFQPPLFGLALAYLRSEVGPYALVPNTNRQVCYIIRTPLTYQLQGTVYKQSPFIKLGPISIFLLTPLIYLYLYLFYNYACSISKILYRSRLLLKLHLGKVVTVNKGLIPSSDSYSFKQQRRRGRVNIILCNICLLTRE